MQEKILTCKLRLEKTAQSKQPWTPHLLFIISNNKTEQSLLEENNASVRDHGPVSYTKLQVRNVDVFYHPVCM